MVAVNHEITITFLRRCLCTSTEEEHFVNDLSSLMFGTIVVSGTNVLEGGSVGACGDGDVNVADVQRKQTGFVYNKRLNCLPSDSAIQEGSFGIPCSEGSLVIINDI